MLQYLLRLRGANSLYFDSPRLVGKHELCSKNLRLRVLFYPPRFIGKPEARKKRNVHPGTLAYRILLKARTDGRNNLCLKLVFKACAQR